MKYNPAFIYPPVVQDCEKHRSACRIFKGNSKNDYNFERCKCCARTLGQNNPQIACCYDPVKQLVFLGPGVPLLFIFLRIAIIFLIAVSLFYSIYALVTNIQGESCLPPKCTSSIFVEISVVNKISNLQSLNIQNYLVVGLIITFFLFQQYLIFIIRRTQSICDDLITSPSDYSIIVSELPKNATENDIRRMVQQQKWYIDSQFKRDSNSLSIKQIIMSNSLQQYCKEIEQQEEQFLKLKKQDENAIFVIREIKKPQLSSQIAIVIFNRQKSKSWFSTSPGLFNFLKNMFCHLCLKYNGFKVNNKDVVVQRAPEPDDIIWRNAHLQRQIVLRNKAITIICSICILLCGGVIQYFLKTEQINLKNQNSNIATYFQFISSVSVSIFNFIIVQVLIFLTDREGNCTKTERNSSLLVKISLFEFFNAGIFYIFTQVLADERNNQFNIQGNQSYQITFFMILNAVVPTTLNIVFIKLQFPKFIQRFCFKKGCLKYTQKSANQLYQKYEIQFPVKYGYIIKTIWLTCFYLSFVPIVAPISLFGIVYFYLAEQFLFKRDYTVPYMLSNKIVNTTITLISYTGFILFSGTAILIIYIQSTFYSEITLQQMIPLIISCILSIIIIMVPHFRVNKKIFKLKTHNHNLPNYDQAFPHFAVTYAGTHPFNFQQNRMRRGQVSLFKNFGFSSAFTELIEMNTKNIFEQRNFAFGSGMNNAHQTNPWNMLNNNPNNSNKGNTWDILDKNLNHQRQSNPFELLL